MENKEEQIRALIFCFDVLHKHFDKDYNVSDPMLPAEKYGIFVTIRGKTCSTDSCDVNALRGCQGIFKPQDLTSGLEAGVKNSAFHDERFTNDHITEEDLFILSIEVSLLLPLENVENNIYGWTIGTHGILITFTHDGITYKGTYLPNVAVEQGWDKNETLKSLVRKAGYTGVVDDSIYDSIKLQRFETISFMMTHMTYQLLKFQQEQRNRIEGWKKQ